MSEELLALSGRVNATVKDHSGLPVQNWCWQHRHLDQRNELWV